MINVMLQFMNSETHVFDDLTDKLLLAHSLCAELVRVFKLREIVNFTVDDIRIRIAETCHCSMKHTASKTKCLNNYFSKKIDQIFRRGSNFFQGTAFLLKFY